MLTLCIFLGFMLFFFYIHTFILNHTFHTSCFTIYKSESSTVICRRMMLKLTHPNLCETKMFLNLKQKNKLSTHNKTYAYQCERSQSRVWSKHPQLVLACQLWNFIWITVNPFAVLVFPGNFLFNKTNTKLYLNFFFHLSYHILNVPLF